MKDAVSWVEKSDTAKPGRGKDRARLEREWKDLSRPLRKEDDTETQLQECGYLWIKRWLVIREGIMTLWKQRKADLPEERYKISACVELYGKLLLHWYLIRSGAHKRHH